MEEPTTGVPETGSPDRRSESLLQAGLALTSDHSLPSVLRRIVALACDVADARYGALGVVGETGGLSDFITHGISEDERRAIGDLPVGRGLLGALIAEKRPVRLARMQDDPRSSGFPPGHPPMRSFLGVPIMVRERVYGNLYLTEKRGDSAFTREDEGAVVTLAAQAGVAIENTRLFAEVQERRALEERTRLARELHDSVSQALFSMTLQTKAALLALEQDGQDPSGSIGQRLKRLHELTEGALAEMRALILALRPEAIREEGLVAAVRKHAAGLEAREELAVELELPEVEVLLADDVEEQLYRLVQEALGNVVRHAAATTVRVRLHLPETLDGDVVLEVADDGIGLGPEGARPGALGLRSMEQRTASVDGRLELTSAPGHGTVVRAVVPARRAMPA